MVIPCYATRVFIDLPAHAASQEVTDAHAEHVTELCRFAARHPGMLSPDILPALIKDCRPLLEKALSGSDGERSLGELRTFLPAIADSLRAWAERFDTMWGSPENDLRAEIVDVLCKLGHNGSDLEHACTKLNAFKDAEITAANGRTSAVQSLTYSLKQSLNLFGELEKLPVLWEKLRAGSIPFVEE